MVPPALLELIPSRSSVGGRSPPWPPPLCGRVDWDRDVLAVDRNISKSILSLDTILHYLLLLLWGREGLALEGRSPPPPVGYE